MNDTTSQALDSANALVTGYRDLVERRDARIRELEELLVIALARMNRDDIYKHDLLAILMDGAQASEGCHTAVGTRLKERVQQLKTMLVALVGDVESYYPESCIGDDNAYGRAKAYLKDHP